MQKCQEKTEPKSIRAKRSKAKDECMRQVIDHVESLKEELSAQEAKDKYYQLIKRCDQPSKTRILQK